MTTDMHKLAVLATCVSQHGHGIRTSDDDRSGTCGDVQFGIDVGGAFVELYGKRMSDEDAKTLIANLFNAVEWVTYQAWQQERSNRGEKY